jgi:peroxiredoxin
VIVDGRTAATVEHGGSSPQRRRAYRRYDRRVIEPGDQAPDFELPDQDGRAVRLGDFHEKFSLGFPLLADEGHRVAEAYGVWVEKSMYGRKYMGNERTTFVIDAAGVVADVLRKVRPAEHDDLVLGALSAS